VAGQRTRPRAHGIPAGLPPQGSRETAPATRAEPASPDKGSLRPTSHVGSSGPLSGDPIKGQQGSGGRRRFLAAAVALGAALLLLAGVAGLSLSDPSGQQAQTRVATSAARTSIEQMLSYNYKTIDAQAARIEGLLTGSFKQEFGQAMDRDIKPLAVKNKTVVQARVSDVGVMEQAEGRVKVLAFVNQATVGADEKQPAIDQNRVIATLTQVGDRWLISDVQAF
jgi:Mce-associated membrane protein